MAQQSALADNSARLQEREQVATEQESDAEAQIPSQLEHYAFAIGAFKDDPMLDAMMANIRQRRQEMDADDNIT